MVIIGNHTQGLGIARSAASLGGTVWAVNDTVLTLSRFSKQLSGYTRLPRGTLRRLDQEEAAETLVHALLRLPVAYPSLLLGVDEDITSFIHSRRERLSGKYFIPDVQLERIYDKHAFNSLLPASARIETRLCSELDPSALDCPGRFILKGRTGMAFKRITGEKALCLDRLTRSDLEALFGRIAPDQVIAQEIVESDRPVVSVCTFSAGGTVAATFAYEKLRQHPNRFGTGTYLRSTRAPSLNALAAEVVGSLDFTGISEIEFIHDRRSGAYRIVEMNPRTWKSVHFATRCGQNLVARYLSFVATGELDPDTPYACDRYWADLATDIPQMLRERRVSAYDRGFFECTWERSDPWPSVVLWTLFPLMALEERLGLN